MPASAAAWSSGIASAAAAKISRSPMTKFTSEHATTLRTLASSGGRCSVPASSAIRAMFPTSDTAPLPRLNAASRRATARASCACFVRSAQV
jgi:hypothetical protein